MGRRLDYEVKTSVRFNMNNPQHVKINSVIQNLDPKIFKSKNQFIIDACQFYIDHYGEEKFMERKPEKQKEYVSADDLEQIKAELIKTAMNEARKEVIQLLGGVIAGMSISQPVTMPETVDKDDETMGSVMDDADVADLAMSWMSKGD